MATPREEAQEVVNEERLRIELESSQTLIRMLKLHDVKPSLSRITDTDGREHPAVVLTPDTYSAMIDLIKEAGINQLLS